MAEQLSGVVDRVTFHNQENGYCVLRVAAKGHRDQVAVVGYAQRVAAGEHVAAVGQWVTDRTYGLQFRADEIRVAPPATAGGIEKYLCSGPVRGIGPTLAARIVAAFGDETLDVIDKNPDALAGVPGVGPKLLRTIREDWQQQKAVQAVMVFLHSYGIGTARAIRIYKTYGQDAVAMIRDDPYRLSTDVSGVGFATADELAMKLGLPRDSPKRAAAAARHALKEAADDGHVCYPRESLLADAAKLTGLPEDRIGDAVARLVGARELAHDAEADAVYLRPLYNAETGIARAIGSLADGGHPLAGRDPEAALAWAEGRTEITLSPDQRGAVLQALTRKVAVITGGPGTGKTTITKVVVDVFAGRGLRVLLCAPTGRAAKRLSESTGREAKTIHRLLEYNPEINGFRRNQHNPLDVDLLVVDETSMADVPLAHKLLQAVPPWACVVFVGDVDQLPSVGPGLVLADLIDSGAVAVSRLTRTHRQAEASRIVRAAHEINHGRTPDTAPDPGSDFHFVDADDPAAAVRAVLQLVTDTIPRQTGLDPVWDIQVLTPQLKTDLGVANLNRELQAALNPPKPGGAEVKRFDTTFRPGDKVMQVRNDYDRGVFNGDIGRVTHVRPDDKNLSADFDGRRVTYGFDELGDLRLCYASTVHKAQGGEYPAVVAVVHTQHWMMLQRNLLYTAVTRGRKLVVLVGSRRALARASTNAESRRRHTLLRRRLARESAA